MSNTSNTRVAAYGLLQVDKKLLLCRLSQRVGMNPGCWTLPGGGLDFGEDPEDAVIREFKEETGLLVKVDSLVAIDSLCDGMPDWGPMHSIRIIYKVQYLAGELQYETDGSTDLCAWHTHTQTQTLPLVDLAVQGIKHSFGK
jgi:ADP-ribose pyrophosphatase YjhB (NUDIX family)